MRFFVDTGSSNLMGHEPVHDTNSSTNFEATPVGPALETAKLLSNSLRL